MKKTIIVCSLFLTAFFIVFSCNTGVPEGSKTEPPAVTEHMTPFDTVKKNIQHYVDSCYTFFHDSLKIKGAIDPASRIIRAYTVSDTDLLSVLGLPLSEADKCIYKQCRVYIGLDYMNKFKLYLTPIDIKKDTDVVLVYPGIGQYLLDLNAPCPSTCGGANSELIPIPRQLR